MISFEHLRTSLLIKAFLLLNLIFVTKEEGSMTQYNNNKLYVLGKIKEQQICVGGKSAPLSRPKQLHMNINFF